MNDAPQVVDELLSVLAARFGATGTHLWELMIRQAYVNAATATLLLGIVCALSFGAWRHRWRPDALMGGGAGPAEVVTKGALGLAGFVVLLIWVDALSHALNPEYFALRQVLRALP